jgi:hypothetical protein
LSITTSAPELERFLQPARREVDRDDPAGRVQLGG